MSKAATILSDMKTIRVSAAVIHDSGKILATQRGYGDFKGMWEFPGGKREEGETGEEAILREIKEELKANISIEKFLITVEYQYPNFFLIMDCYLCSLLSEGLTLTEHEAARWLDIDNLDSVEWLPADIDALNEVKKHFGIDI